MHQNVEKCVKKCEKCGGNDIKCEHPWKKKMCKKVWRNAKKKCEKQKKMYYEKKVLQNVENVQKYGGQPRK